MRGNRRLKNRAETGIDSRRKTVSLKRLFLNDRLEPYKRRISIKAEKDDSHKKRRGAWRTMQGRFGI